MADFVAVIRRAVDGLANNTPEMRTKVYDKARSAVQRQLENMKPTPSEDLIRRQMEKLEAAILSVDAEHAEALPAEEEPIAAPVDVEPEAEPDSAPDTVDEEQAPSYEAAPEPDPQPAAPEWSQDPQEPAYRDEDNGYRDPVAEEVSDQEPQAYQYEPEQTGAPDQHYAGQPEELQPQADAWSPEQPGNQADEEPRYHDEFGGAAEQDEPLQTQAIEDERIATWPEADPYQAPQEPSYDDHGVEPVEHQEHGHDQVYQPEEPVAHAPDGQSWHPEEQQASAPAEDWTWPPEEPASKGAETAWQDVPDLTEPQADVSADPYQQPRSDVVEARFDEQTHASADSVRMPAVTDLPEFGQPSASVSGAEGFAAATAASAATADSREKDPWTDLEELIGYNRDALPAGEQPAADGDSDGDMLAPPPRIHRVAPKKRNYAGLILGLIGLLIVAGGGYALWLNKDSLTELVGISQTVEPAGEATTEGESAETNTPPATTTPPAESESANGEQAAPATDGVAADAKFTQRLLPNGTEVDEGPGPNGATGEGQSVAQLNAPPAAEGEAAPAGQAPSEPSASPTDAAALSGEKMFLYEERLGQTAPAAIEGAVSWSVQREPGANGAQEPVVQGRLNIPDRGLTALLTFKRNTDASLPASHLVEIVFAVPPGFEGGAVDSVQRIAMKSTEQDRGDALIAVPAKITDDFHMIALNDFPDARATNLELLRSRNWMDIPLAYRNGRRALLTLQKGAAGTQAFNEAIQEWSALGGGNNAAPPQSGQ